jgi:hypothetical protein
LTRCRTWVAIYWAKVFVLAIGQTPDQVTSENKGNSADYEDAGGQRHEAAVVKAHSSRRFWLLVSDIMHVIADMAYDNRVTLRGGASIAKAIDLCENERVMPGHSQLRNAWSEFRDVAHLIAAGAHLAHQGLMRPRPPRR